MARLVACIPGWNCELVNEEQIETYGLTDHLHVVKPGSQDAMFSEVFGAYEREETLVGLYVGHRRPGSEVGLGPLGRSAVHRGVLEQRQGLRIRQIPWSWSRSTRTCCPGLPTSLVSSKNGNSPSTSTRASSSGWTPTRVPRMKKQHSSGLTPKVPCGKAG